MDKARPLSDLEKEKLRRAFENWDKPLTPSRPAPKPEKRKRGKPTKQKEE